VLTKGLDNRALWGIFRRNGQMLVFWEQRLAFLATPKTGSTAIAAALESLAAVSIQRPPLLKHTTVHRYRRFIGPFLEAASKDTFTLVALMREPTDWLGSWYRFRQREETDAGKSTKDMSFDDFVRAWCQDPRPDFADVGSQERFLRPRQGVGVDRLFRYEEIGTFVHFLEDRLGCEIILPRLNVSPPGATDLTPETDALLRDFAAEDFTLYQTLAP
jgi:Sulfotransferase family